jgi:hypothetical protein
MASSLQVHVLRAQKNHIVVPHIEPGRFNVDGLPFIKPYTIGIFNGFPYVFSIVLQ